jgi:RecA/RadA recombinase
MSYKEQIQSLQIPTFQKIVGIARERLPLEKRAKPWAFVNHGVDLLLTEDELNCYLSAYGSMHEAKIKAALASIPNPQQVFNNNLAIVDWGCGQGLATVCFFDFLNQNNIPNTVQNVILIEPSQIALERAKLHTNAYLKDESKIKIVNEFLNDLEKIDIVTDQPITLHFFSNILDILTINLGELAKFVKKNIVGEHYFFCVGPLNLTSTRIQEFANFLDITDEQIIEQNQGRLINTRGTIKLLVFRVKGKETEIIKTDFYPPIPNNVNYIAMIEKILSKVNPSNLSDMDKIIQFYKTVIELEQQKEPDIKAFFQYPIRDQRSNILSLDLQENNDFFQEFERNNNRNITKWPKDLFVGLKATLNDKSFLLLSYIIPYDDIKDIDTNTQQIPCKLSDFSIYLKSFEELELSEEKISEIENAIKQENSIEGIATVLQNKIEGAILLDTLHLALSSKNPALSQIYSELNKLNSNKIKEGSLLESFLMNKKIDNEINNLQEEDLVQISNIDDSQKKAVLNAFNNKLSVITGPPGSGKTQVILNILANAVLQNKKVLVASKNNKAVDNVKERFDKIDDFGYFLRFGSKKILEEATIPAMGTIINQIPTLEDNTQEVCDLKNQINIRKEILKENKAKLAKKDDLLKKMPAIELNVQKIKQQLGDLVANNAEIDFFRQSFDIRQLDHFRSSLKSQRNAVEVKYSGLKKIWFNWFSKQKYAQIILNTIEQYPFEIRTYIQSQNIKSQLSEFRKGDDIIYLYSQLITIFSNAITYIQDYSNLENQFNISQNVITENKKIIEKITANEPTILQTIEKCRQEISKLGNPLLVELIKHKIKNSQIPKINNYKDYLPDSIPWRYEEIGYFINATKSFLDVFNITSVTSLSAKAAFPLENELFDMVVIDEASQCDIASAIPLILRTKQLVVIGDPLQLKHISMVNDYEETFIKEHLLVSNSAFLHYNNKSLWDYSKDLLALTIAPNNVPIMIDRHYRCHPHIIGYSNETFYTRMLGNQLTVCTKDEQFKLNPKGIIWVDVKGTQKASNVNVNDAEVLKSIEIATQLASTHKNIEIGIVTPFRSQAEQLNLKIPNQYRNRIVADTVHKFQGDEKDIMIYSLVVTDNSPSTKIHWIDNSVPNLVNVAVTRARNTLYVVGNKEYIRRNSSLTKPLGKLVQYVER